jgi:tRNA threonylcarbamoyladenosine biosynthesis protein TsaB
VILSIDTTSESGSIALTEGVRTIEEVAIHSPDGFGHILFQHIEQLLARHNVKVDQIDCFAAASGPGSFTGVRVGLAAAKGLAEATARKVVTVSNLRALASFGTAPLRATVIDARRGQVYAAVYNEHLEIVTAEAVLEFHAWLQTLPPGVELISMIETPRALAAAIGRIANGEWESNHALDPAAVDANYIRRSDAELFWK